MFINNKHTATRTLSLIASLAIAFTSCVQLGEEQDAAYGYLTIGGFDVDVQVGQLVPTKAEGTTVDISKVTGYPDPLLSSVTVTSVEDNSKTYEWSGTALKLPVGNYTLAATSGSNAFNAPYFTGEGTVEVISGQEVTGKVTLTLANSVMKVTNGMTDHVDSNKPVTISAGDDESLETQYGTYVFVPSGRTLSISGYNTAGGQFHKEVGSLDPQKAYEVKLSTNESLLPSITLPEQQVAWGDRIFITEQASFTGNISDENKAKLVYEAIEATSPDWNNPKTASGGVIKGLKTGTEYKVRARVGNLTSNEISLKPLVTGLESSAAHTKTGNDLDGTDVTTTFTSPAQVVTEAISGWTFQLYNSDETELLREYTDTDGSVTSDGSSITATNGWPYLPKGTYKLKATATLTDGSIVSETYIEVGAPEFFTPTVSLGDTSYTSYDKYAAENGITQCINGDTNVGTTMGANNCQPETLYYPSAVIGGISENLIKNSNYVKKISFLVDEDSKSSYENGAMTSNSQTGANVTSLSWGSHTLTATFEFDGKSATSEPKTHHITGLPYSIRTDGATPSGWKTSNTEKIGVAGDYMCMKNGDAYAISPKFYSPESESINTKVTVNAYAYRGWASYSPKMYISASSTGTKTGDGVSVATSDAYPVTAAFGDYSADLVFNSTVSQTCVYTSGQKGAGVTGFTASVVVNEIHVKYR